MIKKLKCHCGNVEAEVNIPDNGIEKIMRCNCSLCKRKGYIIKSQRVFFSKILSRINKYTVCKTPKNLPNFM